MHTSIVFFIATHVYLTPMQSTHWKIGKCFWIRFITTSTLIYIITKITTCIYTGIYTDRHRVYIKTSYSPILLVLRYLWFGYDHIFHIYYLQ